jgi:hypothetical protein
MPYGSAKVPCAAVEHGATGANCRHAQCYLIPSLSPAAAAAAAGALPFQIHLLGLGPARSFLQCLIQPPPDKAVEAALTGWLVTSDVFLAALDS